jgi:UDP-glucuronate 4-epimerase
MNVILSTYLTRANNFSQHDSTLGCTKDNYKLFKDWYESIMKLKTKAVIFHNELSDDFIKRYQNSNIEFVKWDKENRPSYNDERYYIFNEYVSKTPQIEKVFYTDIFDVIFYKDPFHLLVPDTLYVGSEESKSDSSYTWVNKKLSNLSLPLLKKPQTVYNAGICGGCRDVFLCLMEEMINRLSIIDKSINGNMAIFNHCLHYVVKKKIVTGFPLHNVFKSKKVSPGTYIKHK